MPSYIGGMIDQSQGLADSYTERQAYGVNWFAQVFQPASSYDLTGVRFWYQANATGYNYEVAIYNTSGGVPTTEIASVTCQQPASQQYVTVQFPTPVSVVSGTKYA